MVRLARCLLLALLWSPGVGAEWYSEQQNHMGTQVSVTLWHDESAQAEKAVAEVMAEMQRIDEALSPYIDSSELARLNARAAKKPVSVSNEMAYLLAQARHYSELSDGAFDITFASLGWHYDYRNKVRPDAKTRKKLLPAINYEWVISDHQKQTVHFAHKNVRIDLGGIAKGYAVDRAADILAQHGVAHATVSAGGDSRVLGDKRGNPWLIGIKNPRIKGDGDREVVLRLPLENTAVSTSGDYERFFIDEASGERVHHIMNPKTGESAGELMSVTVLGEQSIDTDALSTTVFVMGRARGLALINKRPAFEAVIIDRQGKVHYSEGLVSP